MLRKVSGRAACGFLDELLDDCVYVRIQICLNLLAPLSRFWKGTNIFINKWLAKEASSLLLICEILWNPHAEAYLEGGSNH